jgi:hypothetical protein
MARAKARQLVAWSRDGRQLATGGDGRIVHVWEVLSGQDRVRFVGHEGSITCVLFCPDGKLISGSFDTPALLWDMNRAYSDTRTPREFADLWNELEKDAMSAFQAMTEFHIRGDKSVAWLAKQITPSVAPKPRELADLFTNLGDERYDVREKATKALQELDELALASLRKAVADNPDLEVKRRCERLIVEATKLTPPRLRESRLVEMLERIGTPAAKELLKKLAARPAGTRLHEEAKAALQRK